jgi:hypothetical protein
MKGFVVGVLWTMLVYHVMHLYKVNVLDIPSPWKLMGRPLLPGELSEETEGFLCGAWHHCCQGFSSEDPPTHIRSTVPIRLNGPGSFAGQSLGAAQWMDDDSDKTPPGFALFKGRCARRCTIWVTDTKMGGFIALFGEPLVETSHGWAGYTFLVNPLISDNAGRWKFRIRAQSAPVLIVASEPNQIDEEPLR